MPNHLALKERFEEWRTKNAGMYKADDIAEFFYAEIVAREGKFIIDLYHEAGTYFTDDELRKTFKADLRQIIKQVMSHELIQK